MKRFLVYGIAILFVLTACEQVQDSGVASKQDSPGTEEKLFTITSGSAGSLNRGSTRVFVVNPKYDVTWTVEGNTDGGTTITGRTATSGSLTVGENETNRTLTVKAMSVENPQAFNTVTVTVDGIPAVWTELTTRLKGLITNATNTLTWFRVGVTSASFGVKVLAYGEGVGTGKGRWVVGGGSDYHESYAPVAGYLYPVMAYSDDDGETWAEIHTALLYQELPMSLIYDGPAGDKKFILSTGKGSVFWSEDGIKWTKVSNVLPGHAPSDSINYMRQVIYGDIDRADGGKGIYIVRGQNGRYTWSHDGKTWARQAAAKDWKYVYVPKAGESSSFEGLLQYGAGIIDGKRVKMFFGEGYLGRRENVIHCYSLDGENWVNLDEAKVDALGFKPNPPGGANKDLSWLDEADTSSLNFAVDETIYTLGEESGVIEEGPGVSSHAEFVAYGNGKFLAVGKGRRLAWTDAETERKK
jgi:hypothetical protein